MNVVNFSGGRTSAYMAKKLIEAGTPDLLFVFQNTGKEHEKTLQFVDDFSKKERVEIIWLEYIPVKPFFKVTNFEEASRNGEPFSLMVEKERYLPNLFSRTCTKNLKVLTLKRYLKSIGIKSWNHYLGIRYDEPRRYNKEFSISRKSVVFYPLVEWKVSKEDVLKYWKNQPYNLQTPEGLGNCDMCFLKSPATIQKIAEIEPERVHFWAKLEESTGRTFKSGISYRDLISLGKMQQKLFSEQEFDCLCNIE